MILLSSWHGLNAWNEEWPGFSGLTFEYFFENFPSTTHDSIAENDND